VGRCPHWSKADILHGLRDVCFSLQSSAKWMSAKGQKRTLGRKRYAHLSPPSAAKATVAFLVRANCAQEIYFAEGRPQDISKVKFAVHALPKQKTRQADLTARANNQIGVRQICRIKMPSDSIRCHVTYYI